MSSGQLPLKRSAACSSRLVRPVALTRMRSLVKVTPSLGGAAPAYSRLSGRDGRLGRDIASQEWGTFGTEQDHPCRSGWRLQTHGGAGSQRPIRPSPSLTNHRGDEGEAFTAQGAVKASVLGTPESRRRRQPPSRACIANLPPNAGRTRWPLCGSRCRRLWWRWRGPDGAGS